MSNSFRGSIASYSKEQTKRPAAKELSASLALVQETIQENFKTDIKAQTRKIAESSFKKLVAVLNVEGSLSSVRLIRHNRYYEYSIDVSVLVSETLADEKIDLESTINGLKSSGGRLSWISSSLMVSPIKQNKKGFDLSTASKQAVSSLSNFLAEQLASSFTSIKIGKDLAFNTDSLNKLETATSSLLNGIIKEENGKAESAFFDYLREMIQKYYEGDPNFIIAEFDSVENILSIRFKRALKKILTPDQVSRFQSEYVTEFSLFTKKLVESAKTGLEGYIKTIISKHEDGELTEILVPTESLFQAGEDVYSTVDTDKSAMMAKTVIELAKSTLPEGVLNRKISTFNEGKGLVILTSTLKGSQTIESFDWEEDDLEDIVSMISEITDKNSVDFSSYLHKLIISGVSGSRFIESIQKSLCSGIIDFYFDDQLGILSFKAREVKKSA